MIRKFPALILLVTLNYMCAPDKQTHEPAVAPDTVFHKKTIVIYETETIRIEKPIVVSATKPLSQKQKTVPPEFIPEKSRPIRMVTDTGYYYYANKKVSVKISPWQQGERSIQLFDLNGKLTYTFNDKRLSYQIITSLSFYPNGAVETANTHTNPGASRYWYETTTSFSPSNIPLTQTSIQMPQEHLEIPEKLYWDDEKKQWVKQLTIQCQPVPAR